MKMIVINPNGHHAFVTYPKDEINEENKNYCYDCGYSYETKCHSWNDYMKQFEGTHVKNSVARECADLVFIEPPKTLDEVSKDCQNPCTHCENLVNDGVQNKINQATFFLKAKVFGISIVLPLCSTHYYDKIVLDSEEAEEEIMR